MRVLDMKFKRMVKLLPYNFEEYEVPIYFQYSQVHYDLEW